MTQKTEGYVVTDMKDGVVEKFTYEGNTFHKKDGEASVGDYVVFTDDYDYIRIKKPYEIDEIDSFDDPQIFDEDGDDFDTNGKNFAVFTKVVALGEPLSRNPVVGDYVVFTDEDNKPRYTTVGNPYKIVSFDGDGDAEFLDDDGDDLYVSSARPHEFYAGETEAEAPEAAQETEVKREVKVGDRIKIVEATWTSGDYANGDIGIVTEEYGDGDVNADINGKDKAVLYREYVVLESAEVLVHEGATYQLVNRRAQAGDVVKYKHGYITRCTHVDDGGVLYGLNQRGNDTWLVYGGHDPEKVYAPTEAETPQSTLTYRDSSGAIQTVIGAELIEYKTTEVAQ